MARNFNKFKSKANLIIRTNTLKIDTPTLRKKLKEENIPYAEIENQSDATLLLKKNIYQSSLFKDGFSKCRMELHN